jgi:integrase
MGLGHIVQRMVLDPRDRTTFLLAARAGHLGPTVYRSTDMSSLRASRRAARMGATLSATSTRESCSNAGESIKAVSEFLGHADAGFTLRTYTHLMPSSDERTRRAVNAVLGQEHEARAMNVSTS